MSTKQWDELHYLTANLRVHAANLSSLAKGLESRVLEAPYSDLRDQDGLHRRSVANVQAAMPHISEAHDRVVGDMEGISEWFYKADIRDGT